MNRKVKLFALSLSLFAVLASGVASAHDFWADAECKDGLVHANMGYGHGFPAHEPIVEDRLSIFEPMRLVTPEGAVELKQAGEHNYHYELKADLKKGDYLVVGTYKPTFWSKGPEGWKQADKAKYKELTKTDASYSEEAAMYSKFVLNVDGAETADLVSKPVGQKLEIVPQVNPASVKPGGRFPVQVLADGKPAKMVEVTAVFAGFAGDVKEGDPAAEYKAFYGRTDLNGIVNIIPLKAGFWNAFAEVKTPYPDKAVADEYVWVSRLTFHIAD